jgi:hypothetical protein
MKKRRNIKLSIISIAMLLLMFSFSINDAKAEAPRSGKWVAVYGGGSVPTHWLCSYVWYLSSCIEGDTKLPPAT